MKKQKVLLLFPILLIILAAAASLFMISPLYAVEDKEPSIILEAGKRPKFEPSDFLKGPKWCVNMSVVDTSYVDHKTVGEYPVYVYHGFEKYTYSIQVKDTTAPTLSCNVKSVTIKKGGYITVNTVGMNATDNTSVERLLFQHVVAERIHVDDSENAEHVENAFLKGRDIWAANYTFDYGGVYTITVAATDAYNNTSHLSLKVTVEEPPVIEAEPDIYVSIGNGVSYKDYITAWDFLDADFDKEDVKIDSSNVDLGVAGDYQVLYTARDEYGLESSASTRVHVRSKEDLQKLINTHVIDLNDHVIIGATNIYDSGYYTTNNTDFIQDVMAPTIVHIENSANETFGSGYILKIDDNFVTIATNQHVIVGDMTPQVFFHDGSYKYAAVVAADVREDIAFLRLTISDKESEVSVTPEFARSLRTVHINKTYWEKIKDEQELDICYTCIDENGEVWTEASGYLIYKEATRNWNEYEDLNQSIISMDPVGGSSGSAIFDGYGYFIAMIRGYTVYDNADGSSYQETVAVPLCEILDYYEMIFHERLHYQ